MKEETQSIKEYFHHSRYLEGVIGRSENDAVRIVNFLNKPVPVIFQRTQFLSPVKAGFAALADMQVVIAQNDHFTIDIAQRLQFF